MFEFSIKTRIPANSNSAQVFIISVGDQESFKGQVNEDSGMIQSSRFEALTSNFTDFELVQSNRAGLRRIEVLGCDDGLVIGQVYGNKILTESQVFLIEHFENNESGRWNVLGRASTSEMISFRGERDHREVGWIEPPNDGHNKNSIVKLLGALRRASMPEEPVWCGVVDDDDLDLRLVLTASVLLHPRENCVA